MRRAVTPFRSYKFFVSRSPGSDNASIRTHPRSRANAFAVAINASPTPTRRADGTTKIRTIRATTSNSTRRTWIVAKPTITESTSATNVKPASSSMWTAVGYWAKNALAPRPPLLLARTSLSKWLHGSASASVANRTAGVTDESRRSVCQAREFRNVRSFLRDCGVAQFAVRR